MPLIDFITIGFYTWMMFTNVVIMIAVLSSWLDKR